jgi:hypothetical protein
MLPVVIGALGVLGAAALLSEQEESDRYGAGKLGDAPRKVPVLSLDDHKLAMNRARSLARDLEMSLDPELGVSLDRRIASDLATLHQIAKKYGFTSTMAFAPGHKYESFPGEVKAMVKKGEPRSVQRRRYRKIYKHHDYGADEDTDVPLFSTRY